MNLPLPSAGMVDPWQEILTLLTQKITFKGQPIAGTAEQIQGFARWMMLQMPGVVPDGDPDTKATCFLNWLRSEPGKYEADAATRMAQTPATPPQAPAVPPANPISDQTVAQQAQPAAAPAASPAAPGAAPAADEAGSLACPECGAKLKNLTGMKRHCTMTHKSEWAAIAQKHGLDISTGYKLGTAPPAQAAQAAPVAPPPPPSAAPVPPMFGAQGQAAAPPSFVAPGVPGQNTIPFTVPAMPQPPAQVAASPQAPMTGPAAPAFTPPTFAQAPSAPVAPPQPPPQPPTGPMVAFNPAQAAPVSFPAQPPPQQPQPSMGALFVGPGVAPPQQPQQGYATPQIPLQPVSPGGAPTRESLAQMLGGAVDLIVVRLLDAAAVKLDGRVDVNQLALIAEQRARTELQLTELAAGAGQYSVGKQRAQRHFADLLTQYPGCYLLQNGYDPIIPDGYIAILAGRTTKFHIVTDSGRQTTTIF